jgi:hypothetical protein
MRLARAFERVHARPETSGRRVSTTSRPPPRARPRRHARPETRDDARGAFPSPPELDDVLLLLGDVTVVWLFELAKKVSAVSMREDFPGWLAPLDISATSAAAFGTEAFTAIVSWVTLSAFVSNAYATRYDETPTVSRAMDECVKTWVVWAPAQAGAAAVAVKSGLGQTATHAPTISLLVALGAMLAWRTYAKVFSLLAPSRSGNEATDDVEFETFYGVLGGVAALTMAVAVAQLMYYTAASES